MWAGFSQRPRLGNYCPSREDKRTSKGSRHTNGKNVAMAMKYECCVVVELACFQEATGPLSASSCHIDALEMLFGISTQGNGM